MPKSTRTEKRYSVCIGINQYHPRARLSTLRYAESDARAMDAMLRQLGFEAGNRCLLLGEAATLDAVNTTLATILLDTAGENDLVVFYFAGHSQPLVINQREVEEQGGERKSEIFLTTYDFDRQKIQRSLSFRKQHALGMERLRKDYFEGEGSHKRLFIFDSCYSGDFYGWQYRDEADPIQGYIRHMLDSTSTGRVALSSFLPIQKAVEDPALGHGRFTYYILKALSGEAVKALDRDGCLTVNGLYDYVAKQLPREIRPVLSGVQQDSFELICFPDKATPLHLPKVETEDTEDIRKRERKKRLKALIIDHRGFMQSRLESFVGREQELADLRTSISTLLPTGGYLTITGQAGQGKSSIIARLVQDFHPDKIAHHFIPFNPGPDYQVSLLRDLMAQLILKHDLGDYYVANESRPALREFFPKVLDAIATQSTQEVIFIDGLDQLLEDLNGERDLSFLPNNPPQGIVFVLGTRPNETLHPLELRKPHHSYRLAGITRHDFSLILQHRSVQLEPGLADRFYKAMGENALYLDLVARELAQAGTATPEKIIEHVTYDPENIFSLSTTRLKRRAVEWREVLKPLLGILLVEREPLTGGQLRAILDLDDERLREGIARLGGLVADDDKNRYTLYHLKLYDYLRQDESKPHKEYIFARDEEEGWHNTLARWCERGVLSLIWEHARHDTAEQGRREYARKHYVTHLYAAQAWERLFEVLDSIPYGQAKIRYDPSTRSYALDLDLGRQATIWEGWTREEGIALLPRLWQYTLLRCSLKSRADRYPEEAFRMLVLLGRKQEALELAELLTDPAKKVRALIHIVEQLRKQMKHESERLEILLRAGEAAYAIQDNAAQARVLVDLGVALVQAQQSEHASRVWAEAERVIGTIQDNAAQARVLVDLGVALVQAQQSEHASRVWAEAERVIGSIQDSAAQARVLSALGVALAQAQQSEHASRVWAETERVIGAIQDNAAQAGALSALGVALAQAQQWVEAERVIGSIQGSAERGGALRDLGKALVQAQQLEHASQVWAEAERVIGMIQDSAERSGALSALGVALAQAQQWAEAERVIGTIQDNYEQARTLSALGVALAQAQQWAEAKRVIGTIQGSDEQARALRDLGMALVQAQQSEHAAQVWAEAERVIGTIQYNSAQARALRDLGAVLVQAQQLEHAAQVWAEAERVIGTIWTSYEQAEALSALGTAMAQAQQWAEAERVIGSIQDNYERSGALRDLGTALAQAQQWVEAERVIGTIQDSAERSGTLSTLGTALAQAQQWTEAERVIGTIQDSAEQARALRDLGAALAQAQQWAEAERIIGTIQVSYEQARALSALGTTLAQAQQSEHASQVWVEAERVIGTLQDSDEQAEALSALGTTLAQAQQWTEAERVNSMIQYNTAQARALRELGTALAQAQQWAEAERVIGTLQENAAQAGALRELGTALAQAQQSEHASQVWAEAERVIGTLQDSDERAEALRELGTALAQAQQWTEAERVIGTIQVGYERAEALRELGTALTQAQQWTESERVIGSIQVGYERGGALRDLGTALAQAQQWVEAERVIGTIQDSDEQARALRDLGTALAQAQQWTEAERVIGTIQVGYEQARALRDLGTALAQAQQWAEAERVIGSIQDSDEQAGALRDLGAALAQAQQSEHASQVWAEAERVIGTIQYNAAQARALRDLGAALAQAQQSEHASQVWAEAEHVISTIWTSAAQAEALSVLGTALAQAQQWTEAERVIDTIQDSAEQAGALQ